MPEKKKPYEKPVLKGIKILEVGAVTCCRATTGACKAVNQTGGGKGQRTVTIS